MAFPLLDVQAAAKPLTACIPPPLTGCDLSVEDAARVILAALGGGGKQASAAVQVSELSAALGSYLCGTPGQQHQEAAATVAAAAESLNNCSPPLSAVLGVRQMAALLRPLLSWAASFSATQLRASGSGAPSRVIPEQAGILVMELASQLSVRVLGPDSNGVGCERRRTQLTSTEASQAAIALGTYLRHCGSAQLDFDQTWGGCSSGVGGEATEDMDDAARVLQLAAAAMRVMEGACLAGLSHLPLPDKLLLMDAFAELHRWPLPAGADAAQGHINGGVDQRGDPPTAREVERGSAVGIGQWREAVGQLSVAPSPQMSPQQAAAATVVAARLGAEPRVLAALLRHAVSCDSSRRGGDVDVVGAGADAGAENILPYQLAEEEGVGWPGGFWLGGAHAAASTSPSTMAPLSAGDLALLSAGLTSYCSHRVPNALISLDATRSLSGDGDPAVAAGGDCSGESLLAPVLEQVATSLLRQQAEPGESGTPLPLPQALALVRSLSASAQLHPFQSQEAGGGDSAALGVLQRGGGVSSSVDMAVSALAGYVAAAITALPVSTPRMQQLQQQRLSTGTTARPTLSGLLLPPPYLSAWPSPRLTDDSSTSLMIEVRPRFLLSS